MDNSGAALIAPVLPVFVMENQLVDGMEGIGIRRKPTTDLHRLRIMLNIGRQAELEIT
jgi:hypothetical protein